MAEHTPGPWKIAPWPKARGYVISVCKGLPQKPVAQAHGQQDPAEREANARLIAAAPDLLAALEHVTELLVDTWSDAMDGDPEKEVAVADARAALAAAKGRI